MDGRRQGVPLPAAVAEATGAQQDWAGESSSQGPHHPRTPRYPGDRGMLSLDKPPGLAEVASIKRHRIRLRCSSISAATRPTTSDPHRPDLTV